MKSKLFTTKEYKITLTAQDALHRMFSDYIRRFLATERKVEQSNVEVKTI